MNNKLFVRNLSWSATEADLKQLFGDVGDVLSVKIPTRQEDGKPRGFAFVEMGSPDEARKAISQLNGVDLHGRDLVVDYQNESRGGDRGDRAPRRSIPSEKNAKLFVRNIDDSVSEDDLYSLFEQAGQVLSVKIPTDRETGYPRGFGFVEMGSVDEAERAIETLNHSPLAGKELMIAYQDPERSRSRPSYGGGGYGQRRAARW